MEDRLRPNVVGEEVDFARRAVHEATPGAITIQAKVGCTMCTAQGWSSSNRVQFTAQPSLWSWFSQSRLAKVALTWARVKIQQFKYKHNVIMIITRTCQAAAS